MKKLMIFAFALIALSNVGHAQEMADKHEMSEKKEMMKKEMMDAEPIKNITLEQTTGAFTVQELTIEPGAYQFEIVNNNTGIDVGFVVAPVDAPDEHIKEAYVTALVANNSSQKTNVVQLEKGEYIYFCPLNKTPQYKLIVE